MEWVSALVVLSRMFCMRTRLGCNCVNRKRLESIWTYVPKAAKDVIYVAWEGVTLRYFAEELNFFFF